MDLDKKRWIIAVMQMLVGTVTAFTYILSVFLGPLSAEKGWPVEQIIVTFTFMMWMASPSLIIGGKLRDIIGSRMTIIVGSILYGICIVISAMVSSVGVFVFLEGIAAMFCMWWVYGAQLQNIGTLFPDRRGFATGLIVAGMAIGQGLLSPVGEWAARNFGATPSIIGFGIAAIVVGVVCGLFIVDAPEGYKPGGKEIVEEEKKIDESKPQIDWKGMLKSPLYWILISLSFCLCFGGMIVMSNGSLMAQTFGFSTQVGAWIVGGLAIGVGVGGLVFGTVADRLGAGYTFAAICVVDCLAILLFLLAGKTGVLFAIAMIIISIGYGARAVLISVTVMNTFGEKNYGFNYGLIAVGSFVAAIFAPQAAATLPPITCMYLILLFSAIGIVLGILTQKSSNSIIAKWKAEHPVEAA